MCSLRIALALSPLVLAACAAERSSSRPELVAKLSSYHRRVTTRAPEAQRYFDQGLVLYWGFDHEEAARSFEHAAELDPALAMAYWGIALSAGPNINNPGMDEPRSKAAWEAARKAVERAGSCTPVEQALIHAVSRRYAWPPPDDRRALDEAYALAMREARKEFPDDPDVGALFAEALMDLRPWDLWTKDGRPQPETPEITATIDEVLADHPLHPGANHLAIHAWEMSSEPEHALRAADRLRGLVPGASHLVHMPGHIDLRLGHYHDAILANQRAIEVDRERTARVGRGGFYAVYRAHNYHFLVYAAQFEGRYALALGHARALLQDLPAEVVADLPAFIEGFLATPLHVLVRFGRWQDILREPEPRAEWPATNAFWHYARGLAYSSLGKIDEAAREQQAFEQAFARVPENYTIGNNPSRTVLAIGREMLAGELEYRRGNFDAAFARLREAVKQDEALRYDEPWGWFQPAAHALGALLLDQGRIEEADTVYRRDLELHPESGWALRGLEECLRRSGKTDEADQALARFQKSWARADVEIHSSCFCRTGGA